MRKNIAIWGIKSKIFLRIIFIFHDIFMLSKDDINDSFPSRFSLKWNIRILNWIILLSLLNHSWRWYFFADLGIFQVHRSRPRRKNQLRTSRGQTRNYCWYSQRQESPYWRIWDRETSHPHQKTSAHQASPQGWKRSQKRKG